MARSKIGGSTEFVCVAEGTQQRIADLLLQTPNSTIKGQSTNNQPFIDTIQSKLFKTERPSTHCQKLQPQAPDDMDISQCINTGLGYQLIAAYRPIIIRTIS